METYDCWEVWRRDSFVQNVIEVDILEERMSLDLFSIALTRAKAAGGVTGQQLTFAGQNTTTFAQQRIHACLLQD